LEGILALGNRTAGWRVISQIRLPNFHHHKLALGGAPTQAQTLKEYLRPEDADALGEVLIDLIRDSGRERSVTVRVRAHNQN
jgi:hypothetical protein